MTGTVQSYVSPTPEKARQRRRRAIFRKVLFGVVLLFVAAIAGFFGYTRMSLSNAFQFLTGGMDIARNMVHPQPPFGGRKQVNILVLGADVSFDGSGVARTDTIKLVTVDLQSPRISILSIPRDTWVEIPGHGHGRINSAYQFGGKEETDRVAMAESVVSNVLSQYAGRDVAIDHFVRIQTGGLVKLVDALGGVEVNVEKKMDYEDPSQKLFIHLKPGLQRLNGEDAMGFVRFRHDAEGDYGRIRRQDEFVQALAAELTKPGMKTKLPRLIEPLMECVVTDIRKPDMLALKQIIDKVGMAGIHTAQLPTVPTYKGRASVVEVADDVEAARVINESLIGPRPTVVVLNGSGRSGLARDVSQLIDDTTYNVVGLGTAAEPVPTSRVIAIERCKGKAEDLAAQLGVPEVNTQDPPPPADFGKSTPPPAEITVVLGSDYDSSLNGTKQAGVY